MADALLAFAAESASDRGDPGLRSLECVLMTVDAEYHQYLLKTIDEGSVMMVRPREATTIKVVEYRYGFYGVAYTGDGSKPGSLRAATFCCSSAAEAFARVSGKA